MNAINEIGRWLRRAGLSAVASDLYGAYVKLAMYLWRHVRRDPASASQIFQSYKLWNCALGTDAEVRDAIRNLRQLKVFRHPDRPKNWDVCCSLAFILNRGTTESSVLDVGCGGYGGVILPSLALYGYKNLYGCDLAFKRDFKRGPILYYNRDLHDSGLPAASFDFITCISVIEHGVRISDYFQEMMRLLRPNGYLLTSTDYWPEPIDTKGLFPSWKMLGEVKIFDLKTIREVINTAQDAGFGLYGPIDYSTRDRVVHWKEMNQRFTYLHFVLRKAATSAQQT
jgi:SAM-dependent methyltransferase